MNRAYSKQGVVRQSKYPSSTRRERLVDELYFDLAHDEWHALREAQREVEASRQRYADLYDFAPVGYLTLDRSGCIQDINLTGSQLLGRKRSQLVGGPLLPLIDGPDRRKFLSHLSRLRGGHHDAISELGILTTGRKPFIAQLISSIGNREGPSAVQFHSALLDISDRKRAEAALRESEERLRLALAGGRMGTWEIDLVSGRASIDTLEASLLGLEFVPRDFTHERFLRLLHPADREVFQEETRRALRSGGDFRAELRLEPAHNGVSRWIALIGTVVRNEKRQPARLLGVSFDITERKQTEEALRQARNELERRVRERTAELTKANVSLQFEIRAHTKAEKALRESEARLWAIMDNSPAIIFLKDLKGRYLHCNRQFGQAFQLSLEQTVGKTDAEIFPPAQAAAFQAHDREVLTAGVPMEFDEVTSQDDGPHSSIVSRFPLYGLDEKIYALAGIVTDITERKRLEQELVQLSEREHRRIAQDLHDGLGQQLAGLWCLSDVLQKNLAAQASPEAAAAGKISKLLRAAVTQTRSLARGLYPVAPEPNGLTSALEELVARTTDLFEVSCRLECRKPVTVEDNTLATHLYRIAQEAVTNAIRHGRARRIKIRLCSTPAEVILTISNDGVGFAKTGRRKGLGLRIMNHRVEAIGGTLVMQNKPGGGAEVVCTVRRGE